MLTGGSMRRKIFGSYGLIAQVWGNLRQPGRNHGNGTFCGPTPAM